MKIRDRQYYEEGMLKFSVLTFHQQRNGGINIHCSGKNILVRVGVSDIYRAKISLDLPISAMPHKIE